MTWEPYISLSVSGHAIRTDWGEFLPVIHFVNVLALDFVLPGESKVFQPHSSIRNIKWFSQTNGYDIMHKFNLIQAYMGRSWGPDGPCFGYGCKTIGAGIIDHEQTNGCATNGELPYTSIMFYKAQYQAEERTDGFSWTKYIILRDQGAISYDDSDTRRRKQDWAEKACYGGRGIWGVDDAVPVEGQRSGSSDVLVQSANLSRRADAHWANWKYTGLCHDYGREIATLSVNGHLSGCKGNSQREYFAKLNGISSGEWSGPFPKLLSTESSFVTGLALLQTSVPRLQTQSMECILIDQRRVTMVGLGICLTRFIVSDFDKGWTGEFGYFRVDDETCAGEWSDAVDQGCVGSENIGFKRFQATLTGFSGSASVACNLRSYSLYGNYFKHPTLCAAGVSSSSATGTFDLHDGPGFTPPGLDHASFGTAFANFSRTLNATAQLNGNPQEKRAGCDAPGFHLPAPGVPRLPVINRFLDEGPTVCVLFLVLTPTEDNSPQLTREDIVNRESVRLAFESAWHSSFFANGTAREVGGWIYRHPDQDNNVINIVNADPGRAGVPFPQLGNTQGNPAIDLNQPLSMPRDGDAPAGYILVANW
ncbi:hypothetical protein B0H14DRAFT_3459763 [Mycena olivaceomarginata]|nr:hypothetical protein B0H14DRAFT_3459763 [Mycena olivaceomarginata]